MSRRRRSQGFPAVSLVPPLGAVAGWGYLHEPFAGKGLLALLALGAIAGIMMPAILISIFDMPKLLVPSRWRAWYRHWRAEGDHLCFLWWCIFPLATREEQRSSHIPKWMHRIVLSIDRYECVACHARTDLQVDHRKPWAAGGLVVLWNLMTLCGTCNKIKSDYCPRRWYTPFVGYDNLPEARRIYRRERWLVLSPARWVRAGFAVAR